MLNESVPPNSPTSPNTQLSSSEANGSRDKQPLRQVHAVGVREAIHLRRQRGNEYSSERPWGANSKADVTACTRAARKLGSECGTLIDHNRCTLEINVRQQKVMLRDRMSDYAHVLNVEHRRVCRNSIFKKIPPNHFTVVQR